MSTHAPSTGRALADPRTDARQYATAVRGELDDLPPDVQEELAGGLDADLSERATESDRPLVDVLGDPATYAAELRSSAGLPPRVRPRPGLQASIAEELSSARDQWEQVSRVLEGTRWWPSTKDALVSLRPAWWLARAWVAYHLLGSLTGSPSAGVPDDLGELLVYLLLAVASVALGRGWLAGHHPARVLVVVVNVLAVLTLPYALDRTAGGQDGEVVNQDGEVVYQDGSPPGLVLDGEPVANLFPYDAQGNPLTGVQLLDDRGRPVEIGYDIREFPLVDDGWLSLVPATGESGDELWNVYPLREARASEPGDRPGPGSRVAPAPLPQPTLAPLEAGPDGAEQAPTGGSTVPPTTAPPTTVPPTTVPPTTVPPMTAPVTPQAPAETPAPSP